MSPAGFEVLDWQETPLGTLCLRRRDLLGRPGTSVTEVTIDHELLMSSLNTASEVALADEALAWHREGRRVDGEPENRDPESGQPGHGELRVLVGGLGLGYTAHAALAGEGVGRVRVVERLAAVVGWLRDGLVPLAAELNADPRLEVVEGDVYLDLLSPAVPDDAGPWDLVLIDVDHSPAEPLGPTSAPFYGAEGLAQVAAHLAPGGVLAVWSVSDDEPFARALVATFAEATRRRVAWTNELVDDGEAIEDVLFLARRAPA